MRCAGDVWTKPFGFRRFAGRRNCNVHMHTYRVTIDPNMYMHMHACTHACTNAHTQQCNLHQRHINCQSHQQCY